jgi:hypothetical protein
MGLDVQMLEKFGKRPVVVMNDATCVFASCHSLYTISLAGCPAPIRTDPWGKRLFPLDLG